MKRCPAVIQINDFTDKLTLFIFFCAKNALMLTEIKVQITKSNEIFAIITKLYIYDFALTP